MLCDKGGCRTHGLQQCRHTGDAWLKPACDAMLCVRDALREALHKEHAVPSAQWPHCPSPAPSLLRCLHLCLLCALRPAGTLPPGRCGWCSLVSPPYSHQHANSNPVQHNPMRCMTVRHRALQNGTVRYSHGCIQHDAQAADAEKHHLHIRQH
jgi:hypothetical protein